MMLSLYTAITAATSAYSLYTQPPEPGVSTAALLLYAVLTSAH